MRDLFGSQNCDASVAVGRFLLPGEVTFLNPLPGDVGGDVDEAKFPLLIPEEHCNVFNIEKGLLLSV